MFKSLKKFRLHPMFFLLILVLAVFGFGGIAVSYLAAVLLHECGHAIVAKKLGYTLDKVFLLPYGACIRYEEFSFRPKDELLIAIAGPLTNIIISLLFAGVWWIFPDLYVITSVFVMTNVVTAVFNILPAYPLDGARVFIAIMSEKDKRKLAYKICNIFNLILSFLFIVFFLVSAFFTINFTYGLMAVFLFFGIVESRFQGKYSPLFYKFSSQKNTKAVGVKSIAVPSSLPFFKIMKEMNDHKLNIIYVIFPDKSVKVVHEEQLEQIIAGRSIGDCFDDCLKPRKDLLQ